MRKLLYLLAMYSGVRAMFNQARSVLLPHSRVSIIHGAKMKLDGANEVRICVHARAPCESLGKERIAGMISVYLTRPGISPLLYRLMRLTSHFGCGHVEIAFYEEGETSHIFAIRNIVRSNIDRLGCKMLFRNLKFRDSNDEILVLRKVIQELNERGVTVCFASPKDCVAFSVNESLLNPKTRGRSIDALERKYKRIASQISRRNITTNQHSSPVDNKKVPGPKTTLEC